MGALRLLLLLVIALAFSFPREAIGSDVFPFNTQLQRIDQRLVVQKDHVLRLSGDDPSAAYMANRLRSDNSAETLDLSASYAKEVFASSLHRIREGMLALNQVQMTSALFSDAGYQNIGNRLGALAYHYNPLLLSDPNVPGDLDERIYSAVATNHALFLGDGVTTSLQPVFYSTPDDVSSFRLRQAYVAADFFNISLKLGIFPTVLGPDPDLGTLASASFYRLPGAYLGMQRPIPALHPILGTLKASMTAKFMGKEYTNPNAVWFVINGQYQPFTWWEFSVRHALLFMGDKDEKISTSQTIREIFGFIPKVSQTEDQISNKLLDAETRLFLPFSGTPFIHVGWAVDDFCKRWGDSVCYENNFWDGAIWSTGFKMFWASSELHASGYRTFSRFFHHTEYPYAFHNTPIGLRTGADSSQVKVTYIRDFSPHQALTSTLRYVARNNADYTFFNNRYIKQLTPDDIERTVLLEATYSHPLYPHLLGELSAVGGIATNYAFAGSEEALFGGSLRITLY